MKHAVTLAGAAASAIAVGLVGCPSNNPSPTPTATPSPTASPTPGVTTVPRVLFARLLFNDVASPAILVSNRSGAVANLDGYELHYYPAAGNAMATASLRGVGGAPYGSLGNNQQVMVMLNSQASFSVGQARVDWAAGTTVSTASGELALFRATPATGSLSDYVRWGSGTGFMDEPMAIAAKLWGPGTSLATPTVIPSTASVITEGATGSTNWRW